MTKARSGKQSSAAKFKRKIDAAEKLNHDADGLPSLHDHVRKKNLDVHVLAIDPGETTGIAHFRGSTLVHADQLKTKDLEQSYKAITELLDTYAFDVIVCEDYAVYAWKAEQHSFKELHTPKLIGMIFTLAYQNKIPLVLRMAVTAKQFVTDEKLIAWGLWKKGHRHARDAMRHAIYQQVFG